MATTKLADVIVPEIFVPAVQQETEVKSRLIASGALAVDESVSAKLAGGGLTFNMPSFKDLNDDADNVSTDDESDQYTGGSADSAPKGTSTSNEVGVRLSRNQSWSSTDLASALMGQDPMNSIAGRVGAYWSRRLQAAFIATMKGVFADNDAAPTGSEHEQGDMTFSLETANTSTFSDGVTNFTASAFLDATLTMGDSMDDLGLIMVHSIVYNTMQKKNLIDFIPDARGESKIPTYLGRIVIVDDSMPNDGSGVFDSWLFGNGAVRLGTGTPKVPAEVQRKPDSGNGGGSDVLHSRLEWCLHPVGHKFNVTPSGGGPTNAATAGNLAHADSWQRAYPERKQIKIARLVTREF